MKTIFLSILLVLPLLTEAQVNIPDSVARYYLEQNEKAIILKKEVNILKQEIDVLQKQVKEQEADVATYVSDANSYRNKLEIKVEELAHKESLLDTYKKEIKRLKWQIVKTYVMGGIIIVLLLIHGI